MGVAYYKMIQVLITFILIGGSSIMGLVSSGTQCFIMKDECDTFYGSIGSMIFNPQEKIAIAVDKLSNEELVNNVPIEYRTDYINSQKQQIFFGLFVSILWFYVAYLMFSMLPGMMDLGTKILIVIVIVLGLGMIQGLYAYYVNGVFVMPYFGFIKLITHPEVLTMSTNYSVDLINPQEVTTLKSLI